MRFAEALLQRGHQIRMLTCGDPSTSGKDKDTGFEMFYLPELKIPIASRLAHKQNTLLQSQSAPPWKKQSPGLMWYISINHGRSEALHRELPSE